MGVGTPQGKEQYQLHLFEIERYQLHLFEIMLAERPQLHFLNFGRWSLPSLARASVVQMRRRCAALGKTSPAKLRVQLCERDAWDGVVEGRLVERGATLKDGRKHGIELLLGQGSCSHPTPHWALSSPNRHFVNLLRAVPRLCQKQGPFSNAASECGEKPS